MAARHSVLLPPPLNSANCSCNCIAIVISLICALGPATCLQCFSSLSPCLFFCVLGRETGESNCGVYGRERGKEKFLEHPNMSLPWGHPSHSTQRNQDLLNCLNPHLEKILPTAAKKELMLFFPFFFWGIEPQPWGATATTRGKEVDFRCMEDGQRG